MATQVKVSGKQIPLQSGLVRVADLRVRAEVSDDKQMFLERKGDIDIPLGTEDVLIIRGGEQFTLGDAGKSEIDDNPLVRNPITCVLNGDRLQEFKCLKVLGGELRVRDTTLTSSKLFADLAGLPDALIGDDVRIVLQGGEEFITIPADAEEGGVIDLEKCAKSGRRTPKGQKGYRIKIDGNAYKADKGEITGKEILSLAGKNPAEWSLTQKFPGGERERIAVDQLVNLAATGVERFETSPLQIQQGLNIGLTEEDVVFLNSVNLQWEVADANSRMIVIYDFVLPDGYDRKTSDLMMIVPPNYPVAGLDMFYLDPGVARKDGCAINALAQESHGGRKWQRWSRHYQWQPGYGVANHMEAINLSLSQDAAKDAA